MITPRWLKKVSKHFHRSILPQKKERIHLKNASLKEEDQEEVKKKQAAKHVYDEDLLSPTSTDSHDSPDKWSGKDNLRGIVSKDDDDIDLDVEIYDPDEGLVTPRMNPRTSTQKSPESLLPQSSSTKALRLNMDQQCFANRLKNKKRSLEEENESLNPTSRACRSGCWWIILQHHHDTIDHWVNKPAKHWQDRNMK